VRRSALGIRRLQQGREPSLDAMATRPIATGAGSRPTAANGYSAPAPALDRRSHRSTLQLPLRPSNFKEKSLPGRTILSYGAGQDRALAPNAQKPYPLGNRFLPGDLEARSPPWSATRTTAASTRASTIHAVRRLPRTRANQPDRARKGEITDQCRLPLATPAARRLTTELGEPERPLSNPDAGQF
jgi:hypothetical protein